MATRSNSKKQRRGKRPSRQTEPMSDAEREDLELAEEILRLGQKDQAVLAAGFRKFLKQLGIKGKPIGAKKLQEMLLKRGFDPESNEFSQGIIAMREE
jgi:hypothetical protein